MPATASTRTLALDGFRVDGEGVEPVGARPGKDATGVAGDPCSAPIDPTAAKEAPRATARGSHDATRNGDGQGGAWRAGAGFGDAIRQARAEASAAHSGANDGHAACTTTAQGNAIRAGRRRRDPQRHGAAVTLGDAGMGTDADDDAAPSGETATQPVEAADDLPPLPGGRSPSERIESGGPGLSQRKIADAYGVPPMSVSRAERVRQAAPDLQAPMRDGVINLHDAMRIQHDPEGGPPSGGFSCGAVDSRTSATARRRPRSPPFATGTTGIRPPVRTAGRHPNLLLPPRFLRRFQTGELAVSWERHTTPNGDRSMRLLVILLYYAVAMLLGFYLRGRYDEVMYRTPHFQRRLRRWSAHAAAAAPEGLLVLPSTLEPQAFQPDVSVDHLVVPDPAPAAVPPASAETRTGGASSPPPSIEPR